ncbi:MAG: hydrogenase, partial [Planctomycetes bacterium]|nr:hydrogenase [Planctomycetota bacterium]
MSQDVSHSLPGAERPPVIAPGQTFETVTDKISALVLSRPTSRGWLAGFAASTALTLVLVGAVGYLLTAGVGIWGVNVPVAWGLAIINFVWWIGIGHAGTLISASLLLLRQEWRNSISRFAEAMKI